MAMRSLPLLLLVAACDPQGTSIYVTVDAIGSISGIDHLHVTVDNAGMTSKGTDFPFPARPATMPPAQTLRLTFDEGRTGAATLHVDAIDAAGAVLASGIAQAQLIANTETQALVVLGGGGLVDAAVPLDARMDMRTTPDLLLPAPRFRQSEVAESAWLVFADDIDRDGKTDIALTNYGDKVKLLFGRGAATFDPPVSLSAGTGASMLAIADWNRDLKKDILVANKAPGLTMISGSGGRAFQAPVAIAMGDMSFVTAVDYNFDSNPDVVAVRGTGHLVALRGNGAGVFDSPVASPIMGATAARLGDLNRDSRLDAVVAYHGGGIGGYAVLLGDGLGDFRATGNGIPMDRELTGLPLLGDVNGDDKLDLITVDTDVTRISIREGVGDGSFKARRLLPCEANCSVIDYQDANGDGRRDLIGVSWTSNAGIFRFKALVYAATSAGEFAEPSAYPLPDGLLSHGATADLNEDGRLDVIVAFPLEGRVLLLLQE